MYWMLNMVDFNKSTMKAQLPEKYSSVLDIK